MFSSCKQASETRAQAVQVLTTASVLLVTAQELKAFAFSWRHCSYSEQELFVGSCTVKKRNGFYSAALAVTERAFVSPTFVLSLLKRMSLQQGKLI